MAKHRNFLSKKSDVLLFPLENLPKQSVPGVRYFRPACCLLPSEALPGAFQKRLQQLMSVNLGSMKLLHTHGCLRTSGLWSVRDCRLLDTKNSPSRCVAGWGAGEENPIVSDGRCGGHCSASRCPRWPTRASSLPCGARRDGPKGGRAR